MPRVNAAQLPSLNLYLLGSFRIERGEQLIHLPTRKVDALLAYLVLHPEEHAREKLSALFWGDSADDQARTSLRTALAALRKHLGDDLLLADREAVRINPAYSLWVDALKFAQTLGVESARSRQSEIMELQAAVALYQGDLLPDYYDDWIAAERERYRNLFIDTLLLLTQRMRARSEYLRAVEFARAVLRVDPANERAHQHLMFCHLATGDRSAAFRQYEECQRALAAELGVAPAPETIALRESIKRATETPHAREATLTNLPVPLTSFIGREQEIAQVKRLIADTRLLTLTGAGGIGKTRLAKQAVYDLVGAFQDGIWIVELGEVMDRARVAPSIAKTLGMRDTSGQSLDAALAAALADRDLLLVLDNCEQLVGECARLAELLLTACPRLKILATSREVLHVPGETVWRVPSLHLPDMVEKSTIAPDDLPALMQCDAVRLFVDRAIAALPGFRLTIQNAFAVAQICRQLDGIPLALELAAARVKALTVDQIAERLVDRFRLLTGGSRTALPRYQTLRALIDWSYELLSEQERALFRRLSVFNGGWTLDAAEAICVCPNIQTAQVLELQARLVDKSLVLMDEGTADPRYRFLETIRQYARDRLLESAEAETARNLHRDWFLHLAEQADRYLRGGDQIFWLRCLEVEHDNLRAALEWSLGRDGSPEDAVKGMRLASALAQFWTMHGDLTEGRTWLAQALSRNDAASDELIPLRARALAGKGVLAYFQSDLSRAAELCEQSLRLARQVDDSWLIGVSLFILGGCQRNSRRDLPRAHALMAESLALGRQSEDAWLTTLSLYGLGLLARLQGENDRATELLEESLALCRALDDAWLRSAIVDNLGEQAYRAGDAARAAQLFAEGLALRRDLKDKSGTAGSLNNLGDVARSQGDYARAHAQYEASLALFRELGQKESVAIVLHNLGVTALRRGEDASAADLIKSSLELFSALQDREGIANCLIGFAAVAARARQAERAARLLGAARALLDNPAALRPADQAEYERGAADARALLGDAAFTRAFDEGRALSLDAAVAAARNS